MENKKENKKKLTILIPVIVVALVGIVAFFFLGKEDGYRMIQVYEVNGQAIIDRETIGSMDAYENLNLISGDKVTTMLKSYTRLKLDEDKYLLAEEDSIIELVATGDEKSSRTNINLLQGAVTIEVENKLNADSTFEVTTPNSVMAIRGTVFRVKTELDENGKPSTKVSIFEGAVGVQKKDENGNLTEEQVIPESNEALIYEDNGEEVMIILDEIDVSDIPLETLDFLKDIVESGRELTIPLEEIEEAIKVIKDKEAEEETDSEIVEDTEKETFTVRFTYKGSLFGTQQIVEGEFASEPTLMPAPSGHWEFDFSTPITEDTEIKFVE
ncbi:MAG: FecR domain-containing protein [Agathobacter sp.]|nr:FecR domain-containing protein [Agathobacter sp.]